MLQTQQDKQVPAFSYEVFDRQLDHFTMMLKVLMDGWEDYSSQEMTFDIHSLCTKAARLCYLADQDLALQHTDVSHHRKEQNEMYFCIAHSVNRAASSGVISEFVTWQTLRKCSTR